MTEQKETLENAVIFVVVMFVFFVLPALIWHGCRRCCYNQLTVKSNPLCKACKKELQEGTTHRLDHYNIDYLIKRRNESLGDNHD